MTSLVLVTWTPDPIFVRRLGTLCFLASRGVGTMPDFKKYCFVSWWNKILLHFQPSDFSSDFWSITGQSTLFSLVESLRDVKLVNHPIDSAFLQKKGQLSELREMQNHSVYMLVLWKPLLWLSVPYSVYSYSPFTLTPAVTLWEMSYGLSWNIWLEVLWQTWWRKLAWMKVRSQLCAVR